jgi:hypothetical protein
MLEGVECFTLGVRPLGSKVSQFVTRSVCRSTNAVVSCSRLCSEFDQFNAVLLAALATGGSECGAPRRGKFLLLGRYNPNLFLPLVPG